MKLRAVVTLALVWLVGAVVGLEPAAATTLGADPSQLDAALDRDAELAQALPSLDFLSTRDWFAGLWVDQDAGGQVVINVAGAPDVPLADLASLLPGNALPRFQVVPNSMAELAAVRAKLSPMIDAADAFSRMGAIVFGVAPAKSAGPNSG